jgi:D-alanyl-D-alanine carboxypeptidase
MIIDELLNGLLLPSGNDAAHMLDLYFSSKECSFVHQTNKNAERLMLTHSIFDSSHGLANHLNKSTAQDIAKCLRYAWKIPGLWLLLA